MIFFSAKLIDPSLWILYFQSCLTNKRKRRAVVETAGNGTETITVELKFDGTTSYFILK